jgi:putative transposase
MYYWRKLTPAQREEISAYRRLGRYPKHSPPHFDSEDDCTYIVTATCYEHKNLIGRSPERMTECESEILGICRDLGTTLYAWCILLNHYHLLVRTAQMKELRHKLGLFHGRSSFRWNNEENARGRKVWHNCFERKMRSERHYFASLNYVLNNAVHHKLVERWEDWPWSNAADYLEHVGRAKALEIWKEYPIRDYGAKWDIA